MFMLRPQTQELQARIVELRSQNLSLDAIAVEVGVSPSRVSQLLPKHLAGRMAPPRITPPETVDQIHALRASGMLQKDIATQVGLSTSHVCRILQGDNHNPYQRATEEEIEEALDAHEAGESYASIAQRLERAESTIIAWARRRNRLGDSRHVIADAKREKALEMWRAEASAADISRELHVTSETIRDWVKSVKGGPGAKATRQAAEAIQRYPEEPIEQIAASQGRSPNTVTQWLRDAGIEIISGIDRMTSEQILAASKKGAAVNKENAVVHYQTCALDGCEVVFPLRYSRDRRMFCSKEHAGLGRRDSSKRITITCARPGCEKTREVWSNQGGVYCSRECWAKHAPSAPRIIIEGKQYDSKWEAVFIGLCSLLNVNSPKVDRETAVEWREGNWYAPDFTVRGYSVEVKGYVDDDDPMRWAAWRAKHGPLAVVDEQRLNVLRIIPTRSEFLTALATMTKGGDPVPPEKSPEKGVARRLALA